MPAISARTAVPRAAAPSKPEALTLNSARAELWSCLRQVKAGGELLITERGVPIVRVTPLAEEEPKSTRRLRLARSGQIETGRGPLRAADALQLAAAASEGFELLPCRA